MEEGGGQAETQEERNEDWTRPLDKVLSIFLLCGRRKDHEVQDFNPGFLRDSMVPNPLTHPQPLDNLFVPGVWKLGM